MEGKVTISLDDFEYLRWCEEIKEITETAIKEEWNAGEGKINEEAALRIVDKITDKLVIL